MRQPTISCRSGDPGVFAAIRASFGEYGRHAGTSPRARAASSSLRRAFCKRRKRAALMNVVSTDAHPVEVEPRRDRLIGVGEELHPHDRVVFVPDELADALDALDALEDVRLDERARRAPSR